MTKKKKSELTDQTEKATFCGDPHCIGSQRAPFWEEISSVPARATPIREGEWRITIQLEVDGRPTGQPFDLRYGDSTMAHSPKSVGYLVAKAIQTYAERRKTRSRG